MAVRIVCLSVAGLLLVSLAFAADLALASSEKSGVDTPLYGQRLALGVGDVEKAGAVYEGSATIGKGGSALAQGGQSPQFLTIGSGCGPSACVVSACQFSLCLLSGCEGSICVLSGCGESVCVGSLCGLSHCYGSICAQCTAFGSVCTGSGCTGSVCVCPNCTSCDGMLAQNALTYITEVKDSLAAYGYYQPLGPGLTWAEDVDPYYTSDRQLCSLAYWPSPVPGMGALSSLLAGGAMAGAGAFSLLKKRRAAKGNKK